MHAQIIVVALLTIPAIGLSQTAPRKGARTGYAIKPLLFKDEGCARDYLKASGTEGVAGRKLMAELVEYGCVERLPHVYTAFLMTPKRKPVSGPAGNIQKVMLIHDIDLEDLLVGHEIDSDPDGFSKDGWILDSDLLKMTEQEMKEYIRRHRVTGVTP